MADLRPCAVGILGNEGQRKIRRWRDDDPRATVQFALLEIERLEIGQARGRRERETESGGATGGRLSASSDHHGRMGFRAGNRCDPHEGAVILEWLAGPCGQQRFDCLVHEPSALAPILAVRGILLGPVSKAERDRNPAVAGEVQHCEILRNTKRIMKRQQERLYAHRDGPRPRGEHSREHEGRRHPTVVRAVVFVRRYCREAVGFRELGHIECSRVHHRQLARIDPRKSHVETQNSDQVSQHVRLRRNGSAASPREGMNALQPHTSTRRCSRVIVIVLIRHPASCFS